MDYYFRILISSSIEHSALHRTTVIHLQLGRAYTKAFSFSMAKFLPQQQSPLPKFRDGLVACVMQLFCHRADQKKSTLRTKVVTASFAMDSMALVALFSRECSSNRIAYH